MKENNAKKILCMILVLAMALSMACAAVAFAEEETTEAVVEETVAETGSPEENSETVPEGNGLEPLETVLEGQKEQAENNEEATEVDAKLLDELKIRFSEVKKELKKLEENEDFDVKEVFNEYDALETEEEQAAFAEALEEENAEIFQKYVELKKEESELIKKIVVFKEEDGEAAVLSDMESELDFIEAELKAAEEEIAAAESELENLEEQADEGLEAEPVVEEIEAIDDITENAEEEITEKAEIEQTVENVIEDPSENEKEQVDGAETEETEETEPEQAEEENLIEEAAENEIEDAVEPEEISAEYSNKDVDIWYEYDGELAYGKEIKINSAVSGYGENPTYQWIYSTDGVNYEKIEGANAPTYSFILDETNCWYYWDLLVNE